MKRKNRISAIFCKQVSKGLLQNVSRANGNKDLMWRAQLSGLRHQADMRIQENAFLCNLIYFQCIFLNKMVIFSISFNWQTFSKFQNRWRRVGMTIWDAKCQNQLAVVVFGCQVSKLVSSCCFHSFVSYNVINNICQCGEKFRVLCSTGTATCLNHLNSIGVILSGSMETVYLV